MRETTFGWSFMGMLFGGRDTDRPKGEQRMGAKHDLEPLHESADAAILARLREGDERALAEIVHAYTPRLSRVALTFLGSPDHVADVLQDVFVSLWERRATIDVRHTLLAYLYRAVRNRAANVVRQDRRQRHLADRFAAERALDTELDDGLHAIDRALEAADVDTELRVALATLPPGPRRVFLLHYANDFDYAGIAALLGVTVPTVRTMMYRATRRLAQHYLERRNQP